MKLPSGKTEPRKLLDMLHVPGLSFNLVSVSKVSENGRVVRFVENGCEIVDSGDYHCYKIWEYLLPRLSHC